LRITSSDIRRAAQHLALGVRFDSNADSNAGELWRTSANDGELLTLTLNYKMTLANRGGRRRTMRPRTSKPLVGILGDVDGRIVPVAPRPVLN
jgi:hypothetical protein